jgi:hypothetical protein
LLIPGKKIKKFYKLFQALANFLKKIILKKEKYPPNFPEYSEYSEYSQNNFAKSWKKVKKIP